MTAFYREKLHTNQGVLSSMLVVSPLQEDEKVCIDRSDIIHDYDGSGFDPSFQDQLLLASFSPLNQRQT